MNVACVAVGREFKNPLERLLSERRDLRQQVDKMGANNEGQEVVLSAEEKK